jgi:hypothetical protein
LNISAEREFRETLPQADYISSQWVMTQTATFTPSA